MSPSCRRRSAFRICSSFAAARLILASSHFDADAPPFDLPIDEALLTFSGGTLAGSFTRRQLDADAQIELVDFTSPTGTFALRGLSASADNELRSAYVMPGETSFTIASISMAPPAQNAAPMFEICELEMQSDVDIDAAGELMDMRVTYDVDTVRVEDNEITAGSLALTVRKLDVAAVEAYSAAATEAAAVGIDPATLAASFGPLLERALKAGPSLTLDPIRFRYDGEPFDGRIEVTTKPERLPPAGTLRLDNPLMILGLVDTKADVRLTKTLAGQLATLGARVQLGSDPTIPPDQLEYMAEAQSGLMLTLLVGQGVLIEDGEGPIEPRVRFHRRDLDAERQSAAARPAIASVLGLERLGRRLARGRAFAGISPAVGFSRLRLVLASVSIVLCVRRPPRSSSSLRSSSSTSSATKARTHRGGT